MGLLHHKDEVGPLQQLWGDRVLGIMVEAGRGSLDAGPIGKDLLSRWAPEPVLTADEKNLARHACSAA